MSSSDSHSPKQTLTGGQAASSYSAVLSLKWAAAIKDLLENKHIYQRIVIDMPAIESQLKERLVDARHLIPFLDAVRQVNAKPLALPSKSAKAAAADASARQKETPVSNVKLFCETCDRREAFVPLYAADVADQMQSSHGVGEIEKSPFKSVQMFLFVYQCQGCLGTPQSFLIRREGLSLRLEGRSPIEHIEVPAFIPKKERSFYRDAVIALHGGKLLAALFYLRTFIEQFARRLTGITGKMAGERIIATYNDLIPVDLRSRMPSLAEWYDKLSESVHGAIADAELYENAKRAIDEHFDIRRAFKLSEEPPKRKDGSETSKDEGTSLASELSSISPSEHS